MRKVEKEMTSPTDEESAKCLLNLCGHQRTPWDPSDPSYELEIKEGRRFCKSPKRLIGAAEWTRFVCFKRRTDRRYIREVGLR